MFEIIMMLGFLFAATSMMLPEKAQDEDDEKENKPLHLSAKRRDKVHVFQDRKRTRTDSKYRYAA